MDFGEFFEKKSQLALPSIDSLYSSQYRYYFPSTVHLPQLSTPVTAFSPPVTVTGLRREQTVPEAPRSLDTD